MISKPAGVSAEMLTFEDGTIILTSESQDRKFGDHVIQVIRMNMPELRHTLGIYDPVQIHVVIAPTELAFHQLTGGQIPDWGIAAADPRNQRIYLKSPRFDRSGKSLKPLIIHELCHVLLGAAVNFKTIPRWFDEGFALYHSGELGLESNILLARSLAGGQIIPLNEIDAVLVFGKLRAALAYRESLAAIQFMNDEFGADAVSRMVLAFSGGMSSEEAIQHVTGYSQFIFEKRWVEAMRDRYLWYAILDTRFVLSISFVILLIMAWVFKNRNATRQQEQWENEAIDDASKIEETTTFS